MFKWVWKTYSSLAVRGNFEIYSGSKKSGDYGLGYFIC